MNRELVMLFKIYIWKDSSQNHNCELWTQDHSPIVMLVLTAFQNIFFLYHERLGSICTYFCKALFTKKSGEKKKICQFFLTLDMVCDRYGCTQMPVQWCIKLRQLRPDWSVQTLNPINIQSTLDPITQLMNIEWNEISFSMSGDATFVAHLL